MLHGRRTILRQYATHGPILWSKNPSTSRRTLLHITPIVFGTPNKRSHLPCSANADKRCQISHIRKLAASEDGPEIALYRMRLAKYGPYDRYGQGPTLTPISPPEQNSPIWKILLQYSPVALPVLTLASTAIAGISTGITSLYWYICAGVATLVAGFVGIRKERRARSAKVRAVLARQSLAITLVDGGRPLLAALNRVVAARDLTSQAEALSVLSDRVVGVAKSELGQQSQIPCNTRAAFYELIVDPVGTKLERRDHEQGNGQSLPRDLTDARAIRFARDDEDAVFIEDTTRGGYPFFLDDSTKALIAIPVRSERTGYGILIATSDQPRSLTDIDCKFLILMAGMLAIGMAHHESSTIK